MTLAFDTLAYAEKLQAAGFTEEQARAQVEALAAIVADNLATKRDLKELETNLTRDIKEGDAALRREIEAMGYKLTIRMGGMLVVAVGVLAAIQKLL